MINVTFSNDKTTVKRIIRTPLKWKSIDGKDGNTYQAKVPGSVKNIVEFTLTHNGILMEDEMPNEIKNEFSKGELTIILDKQKKAIQKNLAKYMPTCSKQIDFLLNYKSFIEGGQEVELLSSKMKELQTVLRKK